ncbi:MAG: hypothetical protein C4346_10815 [Chloroflexota bacterium]
MLWRDAGASERSQRSEGGTQYERPAAERAGGAGRVVIRTVVTGVWLQSKNPPQVETSDRTRRIEPWPARMLLNRAMRLTSRRQYRLAA